MSVIQEINELPDQLSPGISACVGCNVELTLRHTLKIVGSQAVLAIPPGCMGGVGVVGLGATKGTRIPVFFPLLDNTAPMLAGIRIQYERMGRHIHATAFTGDGAAVDVGMQSLSGATERGDRVLYICYDNEGYMNTGFQRSGSTSRSSWTSTTPVGTTGRGKRQHMKDMPMIMAMHRGPYVATASPAFIPDMIRKLKKAKAASEHGLAYVHVINPCSNGWGFSPELSIELCRLAVETRYFPLYEAEYGKFKLGPQGKKNKPLRDFLFQSKKFRHLNEEEVTELDRFVQDRWNTLQALSDLS